MRNLPHNVRIILACKIFDFFSLVNHKKNSLSSKGQLKGSCSTAISSSSFNRWQLSTVVISPKLASLLSWCTDSIEISVCEVLSSTAVSNIRLSFIVRAKLGNRVGGRVKISRDFICWNFFPMISPFKVFIVLQFIHFLMRYNEIVFFRS